jgi:hypothetical protein
LLKENRRFKIVIAGVAACKKRVRSKCQISVQQMVRMSVGGAISASNLALTDATSTRENWQQNTMQRVCFALWASRNRCRTWRFLLCGSQAA